MKLKFQTPTDYAPVLEKESCVKLTARDRYQTQETGCLWGLWIKKLWFCKAVSLWHTWKMKPAFKGSQKANKYTDTKMPENYKPFSWHRWHKMPKTNICHLQEFLRERSKYYPTSLVLVNRWGLNTDTSEQDLPENCTNNLHRNFSSIKLKESYRERKHDVHHTSRQKRPRKWTRFCQLLIPDQIQSKREEQKQRNPESQVSFHCL